MEDVNIIKNDNNSNNEKRSCPNCGASNVDFDEAKGVLRCNYCNQEFSLDKLDNFNNDVSSIEGNYIGSGTVDIDENQNNIITVKCHGCGAMIMVNTSTELTAKCHWCGNDLNLNEKMPNGSIPDGILPFSISKDEAYNCMQDFLKSRRTFANKRFLKSYSKDNIIGVYFPYMIADINSHMKFIGKGEINTEVYRNFKGEISSYGADVYEVSRDFDLFITGLTITSKKDKMDNSIKNSDATNYIIDSLLPFDTENSVKYNSNYLKGVNAERRDINLDEVKKYAEVQIKDIARSSINKTLTKYDRGVYWKDEIMELRGTQWKTIYLPIWLFSYEDNLNNKKTIHYLAVNGRTKETSGSIPMTKLVYVMLFASCAILLFTWGLLGNSDSSNPEFVNNIMNSLKGLGNILAPLGIVGVLFSTFILVKYRNYISRNNYETETKSEMKNIVGTDNKINSVKSSDNKMSYSNNDTLKGADQGAVALEKLKDSFNGFKDKLPK